MAWVFSFLRMITISPLNNEGYDPKESVSLPADLQKQSLQQTPRERKVSFSF